MRVFSRGSALLEQILAVPVLERDRWLDDLLGFEPPPPDIELPRGAVPYLPCSVNEILALPLRPDDELVDLGSGLGRVVILAHLLFGIPTRGIEIQEPLVRRARAHCVELGLSHVSFEHANAADIELDGSVFFLYSPFNGAMLAAVLRRLEDVARRRPIMICAIGLEFHDVPWLRARQTENVALALYDSVRPATMR